MSQKQSRRVMAASASAFALAGAVLGAAVMSTAQAQENLTPSLSSGVAPGGVPSFADLIEHVGPAVVSIEVVSQAPSGRGGFSAENIPPELRRYFEEFFGGAPGGGQPREARGAGSGFFISADGLIVTNNHVVQDATKITVTMTNGREIEAELVGVDEPTDLALIRVTGSDFPYVQFDRDPHYRVGDWVVAVGNPFGFAGSATAGIISAIGRDELGADFNGFIQIDAPINRGNSGGPTFDLNGNVIGVNSQIYSPSGGNVGIGFAIPSDVAANVIDQLAESGRVTRGWLGVSIQPVDEDLAGALGVEADTGVLVGDVTTGSPADTAGFVAGDIILTVDGRDVDDTTTLMRHVASLRVGEAYSVRVLRDGRQQTLRVTLGERPGDDVLYAANEGATPGKPDPAQAAESDLGLSLAPVTPQVRSELGLGADVTGLAVMNVTPNSPAARVGFERGLVIVRADGKDLTTAEDFDAAIAAARSAEKSAVALLVRVSDGRSRFVAMPLESEDDAE